jgi:hypothetical protein
MGRRGSWVCAGKIRAPISRTRCQNLARAGNDAAKYRQPREFIESTQYRLQQVECHEVERGGKTDGVIPGGFLEPLLFPRLLGGDLELKGSPHAYPKVRVSLDQTVEWKCAHRPQTAKRERRSFGYYIISWAILMVLQWSKRTAALGFLPIPRPRPSITPWPQTLSTQSRSPSSTRDSSPS